MRGKLNGMADCLHLRVVEVRVDRGVAAPAHGSAAQSGDPQRDEPLRGLVNRGVGEVWQAGGHDFPPPTGRDPGAAQIIWSFFTGTAVAETP